MVPAGFGAAVGQPTARGMAPRSLEFLAIIYEQFRELPGTAHVSKRLKKLPPAQDPCSLVIPPSIQHPGIPQGRAQFYEYPGGP